MKQIIVATDFSPSALNASVYAVKMAQLLKADVLLFNVFEVLPHYNEIVIDMNVDDMKKYASRDMEDFKQEVLKLTDTYINITTEVSLGVFMVELNKLCDSVKPYLLVMGSQGKTAAERIIFGTHTGTLLQKCEWPLVTVPLNAQFSAIKDIGIAYDFENVIDHKFINEIQLLASDFNATIHILNAAREYEFDKNYVNLSTNLELMLSPNVVNFHFLSGEDVNESIINYVENNNIDLLIVMPKHKSFFEKVLGKSHAKQMVMHSHVPVLALHK